MDRIGASVETGIYIVDDEYRICHFNNALQNMFPDLKLGDICYRALCQEEAPCGNCPLNCEGKGVYYNRHLQQWLEIRTGRIEWPGTGLCNLLLCSELREEDCRTEDMDSCSMGACKEKELQGNRHDPDLDRLTGLYRKSVFWKKAEAFLAGAAGGAYCLVSIDMEHFKLYNEWYGDRAGDQFLKQIGFLLKGVTEDIGLAGYMGEDDFSVVLPYREELLQKLQNSLHSFILRNPSDSGFLPVFGVYEITDVSLPVSTMYDRAVIAMNSVKGNYARRIGYYDSRLKEKLEENHVMLSEVQKALEREEIMFYLQPKCSMLSGKIVGFEALVRWKHPERGMVPPGEFIGVLEKNGFIPALDQYIWEKVCRQIRDWMDQDIRPVPVSVNVSRIDIYTLDIIKIFTGLVEKYQIPPRLLEVEITETAYAEEAGMITRIVDELRSHGFCVSMDDFGSGASSLNMLKDVNVDVLKLDMKFLEMSEDSSTKGIGILETVVRMAHLLGLQLIAEGAENQEQVQFLLNMGCVYGQGYYFYRPMEVEAARSLLSNEKLVDYSGLHWENK